MHKSYYFKNYIYTALLMLLCFTVLGASFIAVGHSLTMRERRQTVENNAQEVAHLTEAYVRSGRISDIELSMMLSSFTQISGNRCFLCSSDGIVVSCSDMNIYCEHMGRQVDSACLSALQSTGRYSAQTSLGGLFDGHYYVSAAAVTDGRGQVLGYAFAASDADTMVKAWATLINLFLATSLLIFIATLLISFFYARHQARPINEMAEAAEKFAHGDFSARVSVEGEDEIAALAASFNQMAESLEQAETRRSEFLANVAHELRTPMTTISGFADGILDGTVPPENQSKYLETISSETKRLNRLVRRMLDMSSLQARSPEELRKKSFDAVELLLQTLIVFEKKINDKNLDVDAMVPEESMIVLGEADAINQVIYNLLENAIKFSTPGSRLGISIFKQSGKAYISIKNHGDTIPEDELKRIFDRFHKTDKSRSQDRDGVGLGLYIVKSILNSHGEDIVVTSRDGVTEFVFSLTLFSGK